MPAPRSGLPPELAPAQIDALLLAALAEDGAEHDLTSELCLPAGLRARARLLAKAPGRLAGLRVFARVLELCGAGARIELLARDGDALRAGAVLARVEGDARQLLRAERTALNCVQRMSGIATRTARFVELAAGRARVLDTRKTAPGLRLLDKYAVRCGGGENHRFGLHDEVLIKDNHVDLAARALDELVRAARATYGPGMRITAEARDEREALAAVAGGADVVLLDNLDAAALAALCPRLRAAAARRERALEIEASGQIGEEQIAAVAMSGVDRISVGAITHSAPALDLSFKVEAWR